MTREELHTIIRQAFLAEYGSHYIPVSEHRFAAGADRAAGAIVAAMREATDLGVSYGNRGPNESEHNAGDDTQPPEPDAGSARTHDPEPATHRPGFHTIDEARAQGLDPLPWPSEATMDRERITSLAAIDRIDRDRITPEQREAWNDTVNRHEAILTEHDGRISAVEHLTHNVTELAREMRTLRDSHLEHIGRGQLGMEPVHSHDHGPSPEPTEEQRVMRHVRDLEQDDDQRLGGHDNPHPQPPESA